MGSPSGQQTPRTLPMPNLAVPLGRAPLSPSRKGATSAFCSGLRSHLGLSVVDRTEPSDGSPLCSKPSAVSIVRLKVAPV